MASEPRFDLMIDRAMRNIQDRKKNLNKLLIENNTNHLIKYISKLKIKDTLIDQTITLILLR